MHIRTLSRTALLTAMFVVAPGTAFAQADCDSQAITDLHPRLAVADFTFAIINHGDGTVFIGCTPDSPQVRAADGTPGEAACDRLARQSRIRPSTGATMFLGDANFTYFVGLVNERRSAAVTVCAVDLQ